MASAIILACGKGIRMGAPIAKQYLILKGCPIVVHTLRVFLSCAEINNIYLVIPEKDKDYCKTKILDLYGFTDRVTLVSGGERRQDSVYNALNRIHDDNHENIVVIHDGVRPFVTNEQIIKTIDKAVRYGSCILTVPVFDTIKKINNDCFIEKTIDRKNLYLAQTPQSFQYHIIQHAHEEAKKSDFSGTDDASLLEWLGFNVKIVKGSQLNIKITTPEDLVLAEAIFLFYKNDTCS